MKYNYAKLPQLLFSITLFLKFVLLSTTLLIFRNNKKQLKANKKNYEQFT